MQLLKGVKVLDFTHAYAGPYCTMELADFGAEVIKIEKIQGGDQARSWGPFKNNNSAYYASFNRGKKSIGLDISSDEGKKIIMDLVKDTDIVVSNFKHGTLEKFGLCYEDMKEVKKDIIFATLNGFGDKGPLSKFAAYDNVIQAMSGIMDLTGFPDRIPTKIGPAIGDSYSGLVLLLGIVMAYYHKLKTGEGQRVDATMLGSLVTMADYQILEYANKKKKISRMGNSNPYYVPGNIYKCKDGYIAISLKNDADWNLFCQKMNLNSPNSFASNDERLQHRNDVDNFVQQAVKDKTRAEIEHLVHDANLCVYGVINIVEALDDPQLNARNMIIEVDDPGVGPVKLVGNPIKMSKNPPITNIPSPKLGQHTDEILESLSYDKKTIQQLRDNNIIL